MKKHIYMLLMLVVYAATSLAQVEEGVWYRIKHVETGLYLSAENYDPHPTWMDPAGGVKCVEYAESDNQIFEFIPEGENYKAKTKSGYYIYCQAYQVDALVDEYTELAFEEADGGYFIKNMTYDYSGYITYFYASNMSELSWANPLSAGEGYYPFCNAEKGGESLPQAFVFEKVEIPLRTITVESNNTEWGTVSGGGTDKDGITITATANVGYKFISWTVNGQVVATTPTFVDMTDGDKNYVAIFEPLLQLEVGKWYRIKDIASQTYLSAENYEAHPEGSAGGLKSVEYTDVANQIFTLEAEGDNYRLKCISGYFVYCQAWNVDALKEQLKDRSFYKNDVQRIQKVVCEYYKISIEQMKGKKRNDEVNFPRQVAIYLCRELTTESFPKIGSYFGGRNHSTIISACKRIEKELNTNEKLKGVIRDLKKNLT